MTQKKIPQINTKQSFLEVDVDDKQLACEAFGEILEGIKQLARQHGAGIPPMLTVCAIREALQWVCGELEVPVQSMLDHYRNLLLHCPSPVDPHLQGQPK